VKDPKFTLRN